MAHIPRENVEILVHTSAPSRGQDDTRYRALATAFLNFEPATHLQLQDDPQEILVDEEEPEVQIEGESLYSTQEYDENASYCPPTQDPETNPRAHQNEISEEELSDLMYSPQLSFRSVLDNRNSPMFRTRSRVAASLGMLSGEEMPQQSQVIDPLPARRWPPSVIEDSMPDNDRMLREFSSPTRLLELYLQQGESTQDTPDVSGKSQFTDESSLNLEVPQAIAFTSSQNYEARSNSEVAPSLSPGRSQSISPPRRAHATRYRDISPPPISTSNTDAPTMNSDISSSIRTSSQAANTSNRRTSQTMEREGTAELMDEDKSPAGISMRGPISSTEEIPELSSALPQHANSKRRRVDFPSSIDRSPKRVKLVISDTTAETSSASLHAPQIPPPSINPEVPVIPSSMPRSSSSPSVDSLKTCTIPSIRPPTSSGDLTPAMLITPALEKFDSHPKFHGLRKKFNPTLQTRSCRPFERGYWLVKTHELDEPRKQKFWSNVFDQISGGHMGWGVSAERAQNWQSIRVNCWGGVVREVYLMLFVASQGKIKGEYACWKDGDGETVISWN